MPFFAYICFTPTVKQKVHTCYCTHFYLLSQLQIAVKSDLFCQCYKPASLRMLNSSAGTSCVETSCVAGATSISS